MKKQVVALTGVVLLMAGLASGYQWYAEGKWFVAVPEKDFRLSKRLAEIRAATQRYTDIELARADGYVQISGHVPLEGYHLYNPGITRFEDGRPSILLYVRTNGGWQLVGLEYAVPGERPAKSPFPGVAWHRHLAMCRYGDWQEFPSRSREGCPPNHPDTKSLFLAWYPDLWAIRLWLWYPNPYGLFASVNPLLAPFDERAIPPEGTGTWTAWRENAAFSNANHNISGWLVLLMGLAMAAATVWERQQVLFSRLWPMVALGIAVFILYRSDPHDWPFGVRTLAESLHDRETIEHKLSGLFILAMGFVEWLRIRGTVSHWAWGMIFPWLAVTGGTILLFHVHPVSNFNYLGRANQPHITGGITAILAGVTYLIGEWGIMTQRWWRLIPASLVILMGLQLILYLE